MYRLLVMDMDGTLLNDDGFISKKNMEYIELARQAGVKVVLATGRLLASADYFANRLNLSGPIISSNGALIVDGTGEIIHNRSLKDSEVLEVSRCAEKLGVYYHLYGREKIYIKDFSEEILKYYRDSNGKFQVRIQEFKNIENIINEENIQITKILFKEGDEEKRKLLYENLKKIKGIDITSSWHDNLEVLSCGVSKGAALKFLTEKYNLDREAIIAIGDNENDLSMIEYAGLGVSVANGVELLKEKADYITSSNEEDGISEVIKKFILSDRG